MPRMSIKRTTVIIVRNGCLNMIPIIGLPDQITYNRWCFPYMRLVELYLSYAEADFEYSGTLSTASLSYLNKVRERCGLPTFADSWAKAGGIPSGEKLREILHDERSIELAMEGRRFHDMPLENCPY